MEIVFERRQRNTVYREFEPSPELADHVQCYWTMTTSDVELIHRVIPDGGMNLLCEWSRQGFQCRWVGCLTGPLMKQYGLPTAVLAVRFRPGGASDFLSSPADRFRGRAYDAFSFWEQSDRLASILNRAATSPHSLASLNTFFAHQLSRSQKHTEPLGKLVVDRIAADPLTVDMGQLTRDFGRTRQQITRAVKTVCGLSPKRLGRILRLQRLIATALARPKHWAALAVELGYYDQAHLIRDFNELTGTSPARFIAERYPERSPDQALS